METGASNFLRTRIRTDLEEGRYDGVVTRFPPEPNGYLHIGHSKAICVSFGLADEFGGRCHLRFDDTNPTREDVEYVESIKADIHWLGFDWKDHLYHASDYFQQLYDWAVAMVERGGAYVDSLSEAEIREYRGTVTEAGRPSPYRDRPVSESLTLLDEMRRGEHPEGSHVLRAKADMAHPNMKMRDPLMYRILHADHDRTGDAWRIYPMYDYAHGLSDAIEGITHSICTLEFENNRALYDFFVEAAGFTEPRPHQYEMARLAMPYIMLSKRFLRRLVEDGVVSGWDDPRMPTLSALRNRGVPAAAVRAFVDRVGVAKANSIVDPVLFDNAVRNTLNPVSKRVMGVLDPLEVVITNWPGGVEMLDASLYPHDVPLEGSRPLPFSGRLFIEREDFRETAGKKYRRLVLGREVRLRYGFFITATGVRKNEAGDVIAVEATYDPDTRSGAAADGRAVSGTLHWVCADSASRRTVRIYERLLTHPEPGTLEDPMTALNPDSLRVVEAFVEPHVDELESGERFQFERLGYFYKHPTAGDIVRIVPLKDSFKPKASMPIARKPVVSVAGERQRTPEQMDQLKEYEGHGVSEEEAQVLVDDAVAAGRWRELVALGLDASHAAKWIVHEVSRLDDSSTLRMADLATLIESVESGTLTNRIGRDVLLIMAAEGGTAESIVDAKGLRPVDDADAIRDHVLAVLADHPEEATAWRGGKDRLAGFFIGKVMQRTGGRADAVRVREALIAHR